MKNVCTQSSQITNKLMTNIGLLLSAALLFSSSLVWAVQSPEESARENSDKILKHISENSEEYKQDPAKLYEFVDTTIIPTVDVPYVTQLILGPAYRNATADQRDRFAKAFQKMLVRTYGNALLEYSGETIEFLPSRRPPEATDAVVRSRFIPKNGNPVPVNYKAHLVEGKWLIYDIVVDNISLITNYRGSFSSEIRKNGLESLIERLEARG